MNTERKIIEPNAVIVFDRVVKASELMKLTQCFWGDVVITKKLIVDKEIDISVNLHVVGSILRKSPISEYNININGDLFCYSEVHCNDINVSGSFYSERVIYSRNIKVGENLICNDKIDAFNCDIVVAGDLECYGVIAKSVRYFGQTNIKGSISVLEGMRSGC